MKRNNYKYRKIAFETYGLKKECDKCKTDEGKICVHHIDNNCENNEKSNLKILCQSCHIKLHNTGKKLSKEHIDKIKKNHIKNMLGLFSNKHPKSKKVKQYDLEGNYIKTWNSAMDIFRELKINRSNIGQCCKGKSKTAGKFKWKYL